MLFNQSAIASPIHNASPSIFTTNPDPGPAIHRPEAERSFSEPGDTQERVGPVTPMSLVVEMVCQKFIDALKGELKEKVQSVILASTGIVGGGVVSSTSGLPIGGVFNKLVGAFKRHCLSDSRLQKKKIDSDEEDLEELEALMDILAIIKDPNISFDEGDGLLLVPEGRLQYARDLSQEGLMRSIGNRVGFFARLNQIYKDGRGAKKYKEALDAICAPKEGVCSSVPKYVDDFNFKYLVARMFKIRVESPLSAVESRESNWKLHCLIEAYSVLRLRVASVFSCGESE